VKRTRPAIVATLSVTLLAAGSLAACGSSGSSSTGGSSTSAKTSTQPAETGGKAVGGSSLKVIGKPNFAKPSPNDPVRSGTVQVDYRNITIDPDTLRVKVGTTVRWSNLDPVAHNVTSVSGPQRFASSNFGEGKSFSVKLTRPGTVHYECTNHPATMNGTIEVLR